MRKPKRMIRFGQELARLGLPYLYRTLELVSISFVTALIAAGFCLLAHCGFQNKCNVPYMEFEAFAVAVALNIIVLTLMLKLPLDKLALGSFGGAALWLGLYLLWKPVILLGSTFYPLPLSFGILFVLIYAYGRDKKTSSRSKQGRHKLTHHHA